MKTQEDKLVPMLVSVSFLEIFISHSLPSTL